MGAFGRYRQIRIDRRGERMHQFGPAGIPDPQGAAANAAETSLPRTFIDGPGLFVPNSGVKDGDLVFAVNLERRVVRPEVDCVPATARRFPTDGAITEVEWVRMRRLDTETHGPAVTRSIEFQSNYLLSTNEWKSCCRL